MNLYLQNFVKYHPKTKKNITDLIPTKIKYFINIQINIYIKTEENVGLRLCFRIMLK